MLGSVRPEDRDTLEAFHRTQLRLEAEALDQVRKQVARDNGGVPPETVGVVFVHGVGSQKQSETVLEFAEPLLEWLDEWYDARPDSPRYRMIWSRLSYGETEHAPARFALHIPAYKTPHDGVMHPDQIWIVAESWWAARLEAPAMRLLVQWAWRIFFRNMARLALGAHDRIARGGPARSAWEVLIERASAYLLVLGYSIVAMLGALPLAILSLAAFLPIPGLDRFIVVRLLQPILRDNIGDHYVYMYDRAQALHVRRSVAETVAWLRYEHQTDRLLLAGHSQGAAVAYDALTTYANPTTSTTSVVDDFSKVTTLITFGSALNNAWTDVIRVGGRRCRDLPQFSLPDVRWLDMWSDYDPVPGGPARPPWSVAVKRAPQGVFWAALLAAVIAIPIGAIVTRPQTPESWLWLAVVAVIGLLANMRTEPEPVAPAPPVSVPVTNGMNVISDHGGYFRNYEEFIGRLADEIDVGRGPVTSSRFVRLLSDRFIARRRDRVAMLVLWRMVAMAAFAAALWWRTFGPPAVNLADEGRALWNAILKIPGIGDVIGIPGALLGLLRSTTPVAAPSLDAIPDVLGLLRVFAVLLWNVGDLLLMTAFGLAVFAVAYGFAYLMITNLLWTPWHEREGRASATDNVPELRFFLNWLLRSLAALLLIVGAAFVIARVPSIVTLVRSFGG